MIVCQALLAGYMQSMGQGSQLSSRITSAKLQDGGTSGTGMSGVGNMRNMHVISQVLDTKPSSGSAVFLREAIFFSSPTFFFLSLLSV